ncbi:hypothetical protein FBY39_1754 [Microbacterium sp. SLBN-146]|nr:hypothetical protein FBY39_1754 [Microbacterium sp. SLBN-146]
MQGRGEAALLTTEYSRGMTDRAGTNEPGGSDELEAARDALVGDAGQTTVSAEIDELRREILIARKGRTRE